MPQDSHPYHEPSQIFNASSRLPLKQALYQLAGHYREMWRKRPTETFAQQLPYARWDVTWVLIFMFTTARVVFGLITTMIVAVLVQQTLANTPYAPLTTHLIHLVVITVLLEVIFLPGGFFLHMALQYVFAKAWRGNGSFLSQCYTYLLFYAPISMGSSLLSLVLIGIPNVGGMLNLIFALTLLILTMLFNVFQLQAVYRLGAGKAVAVVLSAGIIIVLIIAMGGIVLSNVIFSSIIHLS